MKTTTMAVLEADLFKRGIRFIHFTKDQATRELAKAAFEQALRDQFLAPPADAYREAVFVVCRISGCSSEHFPAVIFQDFLELHERARNEARMIAAPECDIDPFEIFC